MNVMNLKLLKSFVKRGLHAAAICGIVVAIAGCKTTPADEPVFSDAPAASAAAQPAAPALQAAVATGATAAVEGGRSSVFRVGDPVTVTFSGVDAALPVHEERIKDDGSITLPLIGSLVVVGMTPGELQKKIHAKYVPDYYKRLVVTVKPLDQVFFVGGEVRSSGRQAWSGEIRVTQAIQGAGGFTDFANKKNVLLRRVDGKIIKVNCLKAIENPALDPMVMPGDTITVKKTPW